MKILHTSDWHLGRSFHGVGMLADQRRFIDQLVETVQREDVRAVLISGDVYDRALPSVEVVQLFSDALDRLTAAGAEVVLSSGNHDSPIRLGFADRVLARGGVHVRTGLHALTDPVRLSDPDGTDVAVYAVPYLEPRLVAERLGVERPGHPAVMTAALRIVRKHLAGLEPAVGGESGPDEATSEEDGALFPAATTSRVRSILMAHAFVAGAEESDSEREFASGGLGQIPIPVFDGFDYVALGHLHGRQRLRENVRYSGSPLPYSFSEARQAKGGWLLDVGPDGLRGVDPVTVETARPLAILRGTLEDLLVDPAHAGAEGAWCQVTLTDAERPRMAMDRLRERFPHTLVLQFDPQGAAPRERSTYSSRVAGAADDLEVSAGFLDHVRSRPPSEAERVALAAALDATSLAEAAR
ncbi:exonuclease SbcCD subunit D [Tersicoccus sp. Bi-70]|uniref:exonuclease SbcCD subunit D n=1 Tax=Tersicoccus sp. Bi-70 TaxID=1897634 RepID=UPI000976B688|nr:exonuclease SbcCD subunit D [Tersicoccus sp. Bi-70]OMH36677.1 exonuclease SbcCD subunit D [Tersicoccus sp. Bi-70]